MLIRLLLVVDIDIDIDFVVNRERYWHRDVEKSLCGRWRLYINIVLSSLEKTKTYGLP